MTDTEKLLGLSYIKVLRVDLSTGNFNALCLLENERVHGTNFNDWVEIFVDEKNVAEKDVDNFRQFFDTQRLAAMLTKNSEIHYSYDRLTAGAMKTVEALVFRTNDDFFDNHMATLAIRLVDNETPKK